MFNIYYFIKILKTIFGRRNLQKIIVILIVTLVVFMLLHNYGYCADIWNNLPTSPEITVYNSNTMGLKKISFTGIVGSFDNSADVRFYNLKAGTQYQFSGSGDIYKIIGVDMIYTAPQQNYNQVVTYRTELYGNVSGNSINIFDYYSDLLVFTFGNINVSVLSNTTSLDTVISSVEDVEKSIQSSAQETQNTIKDSSIATQNTIKEQTDKLNDSLTNTTGEEITEDNLPSSDVGEDFNYTEQIDGVFEAMQNAFLSESSQSIKFEIPFTDKSFELSGDLLSSNIPEVLKTIIETFWYYIIGVFIVKDVLKRVDKIKSGNVENAVSSNIKEDLL